jgi:hypothetical protein
MRRKRILVFFTIMISSLYIAQCQQKEENSTCSPFTNLCSHAVQSFIGTNILFHASTLLSTYCLVQSNIDYQVHKYFSEHPEYNPSTTPAVWIGYTMPLILGGGLYLYGSSSDENEILTAGCAVLQASLISQAYVSVLKAITGRPNPNPTEYADMHEASKVFRFGFLRGGLHYGWPSGHLAVNTAVATSLMYYYPNEIAVKILGGVYLTYLFYGVSAHEGATMHWFSDVVAGTLLGYAIGSTVGREFRQLYERSDVKDGVLSCTPIVTPEMLGLNISISF